MIMILQLCHEPVSAISVSLVFSTKAENWLLSLAMCHCSPVTILTQV